jgi:hypothetical protein
MRRITARSDNDKIVMHDIPAIDAEAVGNKFVLAHPIMHQQRVGASTRADSQCLAGSHCDDVNIYTARRFEQRQDMINQAGILRRGCGTQRDESLYCSRGGRDRGRQV